MPLRLSRLLKVCLAAGTAAGVLPSSAELLYYEGFDYVVAEDGLKYHGGFAATAAPATGADSDIAEGSLRHMDTSGNALITTGSHAVVDSHEESFTVSNLAGVLRDPARQPAGDEIWISLVGQQIAGDTTRFFNFSLRAPDNTLQPPDADTNMDEIIAIGMPSGADAQQWRIWDRSTNGFLWQSAVSTTPSTQQSLLVLRIQLDAVGGVNERYTLWVNPELGVPLREAEGFTMESLDSDFTQWSDLEQIRLAAGYHSATPSGWAVDEIRIADTWQEALPCIPLGLTATRSGPAGAEFRLHWTAAPGFYDIVEGSGNLRDWVPYPASGRRNGPAAAAAEFSPPAGAEPGRFFRVRRSD